MIQMLGSCLIEFFMSYKIYVKNSRHFLSFFLSFIIQIVGVGLSNSLTDLAHLKNLTGFESTATPT